MENFFSIPQLSFVVEVTDGPGDGHACGGNVKGELEN